MFFKVTHGRHRGQRSTRCEITGGVQFLTENLGGGGKTIYQIPLGRLENWATESTRAVAMSNPNRCTMGSIDSIQRESPRVQRPKLPKQPIKWILGKAILADAKRRKSDKRRKGCEKVLCLPAITNHLFAIEYQKTNRTQTVF